MRASFFNTAFSYTIKRLKQQAVAERRGSMQFNGTITKHIDSILWQGYRGSESGMIIYYATDPVSEIPIREVPEDYPSTIEPEPNYETKSFGFYGCARTKIRAAFIKAKFRYLFFVTKYVGANYDFLDQVMVTGFYRISHTANVQKLHTRHLNESSCISEDSCIAVRADEAHFVSLENAFVLTPEVFKKWNVSSRVTRQTRIVLSEADTTDLLVYLRSKPNVIAEYIEETKQLQPATEIEEVEGEGDADSEETAAASEIQDDEQA
jgi:hypothetical protein